MKYHPDRNPDHKTEEQFKEAKEAYEVLTDENKRAAYDRHGHAGVDHQAGMAGAGAGFSNFADAFGDIFGDIFGQARGGRSSVYRGADLRYNLEISLEQAAHGTETKIRIPAMEECETCEGTGAKPGHRAPRPARPAAATARCACSRAFSPSSRPAPSATAPAKSFPIPARPATAPGA